jgi:hypothetical protein
MFRRPRPNVGRRSSCHVKPVSTKEECPWVAHLSQILLVGRDYRDHLTFHIHFFRTISSEKKIEHDCTWLNRRTAREPNAVHHQRP